MVNGNDLVCFEENHPELVEEFCEKIKIDLSDFEAYITTSKGMDLWGQFIIEEFNDEQIGNARCFR